MSDISLLNKIQKYDKDHCYQYQKRLDTFKNDKLLFNLFGYTDDDINNISLDDFEFRNLTTKEEKDSATEFIKRYEWLGTIGPYPTHWFGAYYKTFLFGVVIMGMPNSFSKLLGEKTKDLERLIARGASSSLAPKNLGSKFLMWCIKWMVENTQYRLFTCYSDPQAKELGTIYQSLNFFYLGQNNGASVRCISPYDKNKIVSDRVFRTIRFYKRYAKDLGIKWDKNWVNNRSMVWENVPSNIKKTLIEYSKKIYNECEKVEFPKKHKYAFILGRDKRETNTLRKEFMKLNKLYDYPKQRGE